MNEALTNASGDGSKKKVSWNLFFSDAELIKKGKKKLELEQNMVWDEGGAKAR